MFAANYCSSERSLRVLIMNSFIRKKIMNVILRKMIDAVSLPIFLIVVFVNFSESASETRILNGYPSKIGQFPYVIFIRFEKDHCTGSLIKPDKVLTAAHCYSDIPEGCTDCDLGTCIAGGVNITRGEPAEQQALQFRLVTRLIVHPIFKGWHVPNDVAILTVEQPFHLNVNVATIKLANFYMKITESCISVGYGRQDFNGSKSTETQLAWFRSNVFKIGCQLGKTICTKTEGKAVYKGDSGGPLIKNMNLRLVFGVVSCAAKGDDPYSGTAYASVIENRKWILDNLNRGFSKRVGKSAADARTNRFSLILLIDFLWTLSWLIS